VNRLRNCGPLLELDELQRLLGINERAHLGTRAIPVAAIVGTVGRCCDFDRCFHPLRPALRASSAAVRARFADGAVPAIDAFKVGDAYFVSDGHKRVAAARAAGTEFVDAQLTEIRSPYRIDATLERDELLLTERERWFLNESGLAEARPSVRVTAGSNVAYTELLRSVQAHGYELLQDAGAVLPEGEVAAHWLDCLYQPTIAAARARGLDALLAPLPEAELFLLLDASERLALADPGTCDELQAAATEAAAELAATPPRRPLRGRLRSKPGSRPLPDG
jgi:hypothetical protein